MLPGAYTVATLPPAAQQSGNTLLVVDSYLSEAAGNGSIVVPGGTSCVRVRSDGTVWRVSGRMASGIKSSGGAGLNAWRAAVIGGGGTVSTARFAQYQLLVKRLEQAGIWQKLDRLWIFAAENAPSARFDLVGQNPIVLVTGGNTFTVDRGYAGDGIGAYIASGYIPGGSNKWQIGNAHFSVYLRTDTPVGVDQTSIGADGLTRYFPRFTDNVAYWTINGGGGGFVEDTTTKGFWVANILDDFNSFDKDGVFTSGVPTAGTNIPVVPMSIGANLGPSSFSTGQHAAVSFGAGLTALQRTQYYTYMQEYMTAVGAAV